MKELIEKINSYNFDNLESVEDFYQIEEFQQAILQDLEKIQEQESKEFNPVVLGFTKLNDIIFNKYENNCEFILERMRTPNLWLLKQIINGERFKFDPISLMIPNQRQGVEVLRVLGIIA